MKIIAGKFKGKKLFLPLNKNTRPLKNIVKESIFNLLEHSKKFNINLKNSLVLDLFSGSGSFGIECISRGSESVYFFENYIEAIKILKKNLFALEKVHNYKIFESNREIGKKFDIIFIDPPYKEIKINELLEKIISKKILKSQGIFIIHRHKKDKLDITDKINVLDVRNYGLSRVYIAN